MLNITRFEQLLEKIADNQLYTDFQPDSRFEDLLLKIAAKVDAGGSGGGSDGTIVTKVYDTTIPLPHDAQSELDHIIFNTSLSREEMVQWYANFKAKYPSTRNIIYCIGESTSEEIPALYGLGILPLPNIPDGFIIVFVDFTLGQQNDLTPFIVYSSDNAEVIDPSIASFTAKEGWTKTFVNFPKNKVNNVIVQLPNAQEYCQDLSQVFGLQIKGINDHLLYSYQSKQLKNFPIYNVESIKNKHGEPIIIQNSVVETKNILPLEKRKKIENGMSFYNAYNIILDLTGDSPYAIGQVFKNLLTKHNSAKELTLFARNHGNDPLIVKLNESNNIELYEGYNLIWKEDSDEQQFYYNINPTKNYDSVWASRSQEDYDLLQDLMFALPYNLCPEQLRKIYPDERSLINYYDNGEFALLIQGDRLVSSYGNRFAEEKWSFELEDGSIVEKTLLAGSKIHN